MRAVRPGTERVPPRGQGPGNRAQAQAIAHREGPAMVLAGPGSGKTFVVTERIRSLIEEAGVPPDKILTITFTRAAAAEMRQRFSRLTEHRYPDATFGTFHSIFYGILRDADPQEHQNGPALLAEHEKTKILRLLLADVRERDRGVTVSDELIAAFINEISRLKNGGTRPGDLDPEALLGLVAEGLPHREHFPAVFAGYERMLGELGRIDFDDMVLRCLELLQQEPKVLSRLRARYQYLLIDEYQDINHLQFEIARLLAWPRNNLFVVGDDDQAIYGFRGARPEYMLRFSEDYPGAARYLLQVNYRCRARIIDAAGRVIALNGDHRFEKPQRAGRPEPGEVSLRKYPGRREEADAIAAYLAAGRDTLGAAAVIVRTNAQGEALARRLEAAGVPVRGMGCRRNPWKEREIQDVLAYLRLAGPAPDQSDLFRVMNRPLRYLSRECARDPRISQANMERYYSDRPSMLPAVRQLWRQLKLMGGMRPALAIRFLRNQVGYDAFVRDSGEYPDPQASLRRLDDLMEGAKKFAQTSAFLRNAEEREAAWKPEGPGVQDLDPKARGAGVRVLTMHASKGLEFDTVWVPELNEGTMPARRIVRPEQVEEERRLLYVAMTRAKERLILSCLAGTEGYAYVPSRFLAPIMDLC